ncbi:hypothetical protein B0H14DRAFT_3719249 [Mycena olivaceomarginata]|nr:hypothetical protein B0H14DRAFT_3719249 [Mycena olivaceomarginata]
MYPATSEVDQANIQKHQLPTFTKPFNQTAVYSEKVDPNPPHYDRSDCRPHEPRPFIGGTRYRQLCQPIDKMGKVTFIWNLRVTVAFLMRLGARPPVITLEPVPDRGPTLARSGSAEPEKCQPACGKSTCRQTGHESKYFRYILVFSCEAVPAVIREEGRAGAFSFRHATVPAEYGIAGGSCTVLSGFEGGEKYLCAKCEVRIPIPEPQIRTVDDEDDEVAEQRPIAKKRRQTEYKKKQRARSKQQRAENPGRS